MSSMRFETKTRTLIFPLRASAGVALPSTRRSSPSVFTARPENSTRSPRSSRRSASSESAIASVPFSLEKKYGNTFAT